MTEKRDIPHATEAEEAVIGMCLYRFDAIRLAAAVLSAGDFYSPRLGIVFAVMLAMDERGEPVEAQAVAVECGKADVDVTVADLFRLTAEAPSASNVVHYARVIATRAAQRRLMAIAGDVTDEARRLDDPVEVIDRATSALRDVLVPDSTGLPSGAMSVDEWLVRPSDDDGAPWVIPGLLRVGHRAIFVSDSGAGKSWLTSQIAVAASQGIHPFGFLRHVPVNTLVIDAENPPDAIDERLRRLVSKARDVTGKDYREHGCYVWSKMGGINLRARTDRAHLEGLLRHVRPSLVVLGPLYKAFRRRPNEDHEDAALDVQNVLDDLRTRYRFALVIEAHAPHGELRVRGSTAWGNWPEVGMGLRPTDKGGFDVERFRGDRVKLWWPVSYARGPVGEWPWQGEWESNEWRTQMVDKEGELW